MEIFTTFKLLLINFDNGHLSAVRFGININCPTFDTSFAFYNKLIQVVLIQVNFNFNL